MWLQQKKVQLLIAFCVAIPSLIGSLDVIATSSGFWKREIRTTAVF